MKFDIHDDEKIKEIINDTDVAELWNEVEVGIEAIDADILLVNNLAKDIDVIELMQDQVIAGLESNSLDLNILSNQELIVSDIAKQYEETIPYADLSTDTGLDIPDYAQVGLEAKAGILGKIMDKLKLLIKGIIRAVKSLFGKLMNIMSAIGVNIESLVTDIDALEETAEIDLGSTENESVAKKVAGALGFSANRGNIKGSISNLVKMMDVNFEASMSKGPYAVYEGLKDGASAKTAEKAKGILAKLFSFLSQESPKIVKTIESEIKSLKIEIVPENKRQYDAFLVKKALTFIFALTPDSVNVFTVVSRGAVSDSKIATDRLTLTTKGDMKDVKYTVKKSDMVDAGKDLEKAFKSFNVGDVRKVVDKRLKEIDKDVSGFKRSESKTAVDAVMVFTNFYNKAAIGSIKSILACQKGGHKALSVLVREMS